MLNFTITKNFMFITIIIAKFIKVVIMWYLINYLLFKRLSCFFVTIMDLVISITLLVRLHFLHWMESIVKFKAKIVSKKLKDDFTYTIIDQDFMEIMMPVKVNLKGEIVNLKLLE